MPTPTLKTDVEPDDPGTAMAALCLLTHFAITTNLFAEPWWPITEPEGSTEYRLKTGGIEELGYPSRLLHSLGEAHIPLPLFFSTQQTIQYCFIKAKDDFTLFFPF